MKKLILTAAIAAILPSLAFGQVGANTLPANGAVTGGANFIARTFTYVASEDVVVNFINGPTSLVADAYHPRGTVVTTAGGRTAANGNVVQAFGGTSDGGQTGECGGALALSAAQVLAADGVTVATAAVVGGC
jgi:hypothetical protein